MSRDYEIVASQLIIADYHRIRATARLRGFQRVFDACALELFRRLRREPTDFGEPRYHLRHLHLEMRIAAVGPFAVSYGVDAANRRVYLSRVSLLKYRASPS